MRTARYLLGYLNRCAGRCPLQPLHVDGRGPRINAADPLTDLPQRPPACRLPAGLYQAVQSYQAPWDEKPRKKPSGVGLTSCLRRRTADRDNPYELVLSGLRVAVTALRVAVHVQSMDLSTQRAGLAKETVVAFLLEFGYAVFDDCAVFTVVSGAPSVGRRGAPLLYLTEVGSAAVSLRK